MPEKNESSSPEKSFLTDLIQSNSGSTSSINSPKSSYSRISSGFKTSDDCSDEESHETCSTYVGENPDNLELVGFTPSQKNKILVAWNETKSFLENLPEEITEFLGRGNNPFVQYFGEQVERAFHNLLSIKYRMSSVALTFKPLYDREAEGTPIALSLIDDFIIKISSKFYESSPLDRFTTILHELTHIFAHTIDDEHCYSSPSLAEWDAGPSSIATIKNDLKTYCKNLAKTDPNRAVNNAYNYAFFAEAMLSFWKKILRDDFEVDEYKVQMDHVLSGLIVAPSKNLPKDCLLQKIKREAVKCGISSKNALTLVAQVVGCLNEKVANPSAPEVCGSLSSDHFFKAAIFYLLHDYTVGMDRTLCMTEFFRPRFGSPKSVPNEPMLVLPVVSVPCN